MARRDPSDPVYDLRRIRKGRSKVARTRWRIMIAGDPSRPIRTLSLPAALPTVVTLAVGLLALGAVVLACGSWRVQDARAALEHRVHAMVQAANALALELPGRPTRLPRERANPEDTFFLRAPAGPQGRFVVQSVNTGEEMEVSFNLDTGEVNADCYRRLRHMMRCMHTGAETPIDPRLIDLLYRIAQRTQQKIQLVSGFRAPMYSLAQLSYHTRGMAADIRLPGMTALMARDLAESIGVHGLGYYPVSGFIHVDVRDERMRWTDYGPNRMDSERAEHGYSRTEVAEPAELEASESVSPGAGPRADLASGSGPLAGAAAPMAARGSVARLR